MSRCWRAIVAGVLGLILAAPEARAQWGYPGGYGGYGWGGWGSTPQGSMARGLGAFAYGAGQYNVDTAQAASINTDTVLRWNSAIWSAQHALNTNYYYRRMHKRAANIQANAQIYDRLRNHPNQGDIEDGDALNVALDELLDPKVYGSVIRTVRTPLPPAVIKDIPFEHASEAVTICLDDLTAQNGWPPALREPAFAPYRDAVTKAVDEALAEDEKGLLTPPTVDKVSDAVARLRARFEATIPQNSPDYIPAANHLKAMAGMAKMLHSPQVEEILAGIEKYPGTTIGDLLAFMHMYNLRFSPAKTPRQREIYQQLFAELDRLRDSAPGTEGAFARASSMVNDAGNSISSAAKSFFQGMGWQHVENAPKK